MADGRSWPRQGSYENEIQESSPEVKKVRANTTIIEEHGSMLSRFERFSNWQGLKPAVTLCMEYKRRLRMSIGTADEKTPVDESSPINGRSCKSESYPTAGIMVQDLEQAEVEIFKNVQRDAFDKEVKALKESQAQTEGACKDRQCAKERKALLTLKKTSSLNTLDPYLDVTGVLRVGGQIIKANLTDSLRNPVILPKTGHITELIIRHIHKKAHHCGGGVTLNELRLNCYGIINGNAAVGRFISRCVRCRYLRGTAGEQKMASLQKSRVEPAPPFSYCAVDCKMINILGEPCKR